MLSRAPPRAVKDCVRDRKQMKRIAAFLQIETPSALWPQQTVLDKGTNGRKGADPKTAND